VYKRRVSTTLNGANYKVDITSIGVVVVNALDKEGKKNGEHAKMGVSLKIG